LYSRSNKEKDLIAKVKLSKEAKALTPDIKVLRSQIKSLDYIRKRSSKYREYNKQLEQKRNSLAEQCVRKYSTYSKLYFGLLYRNQQ